jgi:L-rhamnose mutarotase
MKRYCLTLDLKPDATLIAAYKEHHKAVWPEIMKSFKDAGIINMEIYLHGNRMFMIVEVKDSFTFYGKSVQDAANPKVQEWETLMSNYQQALPTAQVGEKWILMDKIFPMT